MKFITHLFIVILVAGFGSCKLNNRAFQTYEYMPLEQYEYKQAGIQPGTEVELLAFSGGKEGDENSVYYYQFIVLDKANGDTLRILTPLISVEEPDLPNKTYTTPLLYDPEKGITNAFYERMDSTQNLLLQVEKFTKSGGSLDSVDINSMMKMVDKKQFVVINKSMPEFENPNYRTAIGVLNFKGMPWYPK